MEVDGDEEQSVQEAYTPHSQCFGCGARAWHLTLKVLPNLVHHAGHTLYLLPSAR